ncbi:hypothetical protein MSAN_01769400 [Mycena sanguinolenta]|uniref:DUF6534 domain-containing protein n=1 Tax=Mycena sanguinolenta TaxID=230812 RepID=A0A8H6XU42_9AGAR|nr:hypothetical protein MSAN_01769400 [Mycena sanguinolenta]
MLGSIPRSPRIPLRRRQGGRVSRLSILVNLSDYLFDIRNGISRTGLSVCSVLFSVRTTFIGYPDSDFLARTKRRFVTGFLVFSIFFHLGFSYASAGLVLEERNPLGKALTTTQIGAISCAATDCLIAVLLACSFYQMESRTIKGRTTQSILRRLGVLSVTSGFIVASITLIAVVGLLKGENYYTLFFYCQGRAYALTLLANFMMGLPAGAVEPDLQALSRTASGRRPTDSGVIFHVAYGPRSSADTPHPESLNLEDVSEIGVKAHPDPDPD